MTSVVCQTTLHFSTNADETAEHSEEDLIASRVPLNPDVVGLCSSNVPLKAAINSLIWNGGIASPLLVTSTILNGDVSFSSLPNQPYVWPLGQQHGPDHADTAFLDKPCHCHGLAGSWTSPHCLVVSPSISAVVKYSESLSSGRYSQVLAIPVCCLFSNVETEGGVDTRQRIEGKNEVNGAV
jgi:hypothetical protein